MNLQAPSLGSLCISLAGHDKGRTYVIVEVIDSEFAAVADGVYRSIKTPKKKRLKHLKIMYGSVENEIIAKITEKTLKDNELHKIILFADETRSVSAPART